MTRTLNRMGVMADRKLLTARSAAAAIRLATEALAHLARATTSEEIQDFVRAPGSTGDQRFDTLLATLTRLHLSERGTPVPEWTDAPPLAREWLPGATGQPIPEWLAIVRAQTPALLLRKNILSRVQDWTAA
ncbi:hypothetical protein [Rathayibacter iranicus]|uniref:Uncharacterized protein n=1 Tax=Rathayibacter iranicus TaxID=59737 RepID=A0AAD1ABZ6_9MICO|nr:hypothetical protein [Rathayibacter iranicus]AZZ55427.1 hypothetical protein C7V51_05670 [Rathayibacter iranicus]MWV30831.1 hypothetical protein [Rathayibacter iranicus NCPPB 2253 = VKM Ac-1602]PPI48215.1 hypothetical protein C5E09_04740 [Rathayibacter iranicus]PPI61431.1 hypothetical protein C5E08_05650 [Rathayibacter iranicus]PPI72625.1 hypothetical protein C5E01_04975 [Rathayibacter iranicus]